MTVIGNVRLLLHVDKVTIKNWKTFNCQSSEKIQIETNVYSFVNKIFMVCCFVNSVILGAQESVLLAFTTQNFVNPALKSANYFYFVVFSLVAFLTYQRLCPPQESGNGRRTRAKAIKFFLSRLKSFYVASALHNGQGPLFQCTKCMQPL